MKQPIKTFEELDRFLEEVEASGNDDEMRRLWHGCDFDWSSLFTWYPDKLRSLDPMSDEYFDLVVDFFRHLHGADYDLSNEGMSVNMDFIVPVGYPYSTRSPETVGGFLLAYGFIIRVMDIAPPATILDIGSGVGGLSIPLAKMGYDITCVDANADFLEVIRRSTSGLPNTITLVNANMEDLDFEEKFDVVLFMESFHHSLRHRKTLTSAIKNLKDDGKIVFAAEPIVSSYEALPYPWGPRLDGESIRSIRKYGWIELGFEEDYFYNLLRDVGFTYRRHTSSESPWADAIIATRGLRIGAGDTLNFFHGGNGAACLQSGWSGTEPFGTWSLGNNSSIHFFVPKDILVSPQLSINLQTYIFSSKDHGAQKVGVKVNGAAVAELNFSGNKIKLFSERIVLATDIIESSGSIQLEFHISNPKSPSQLGLSEDVRLLGIGIESLSVSI
jgi:SAM-dependent methyltransferase